LTWPYFAAVCGSSALYVYYMHVYNFIRSCMQSHLATLRLVQLFRVFFEKVSKNKQTPKIVKNRKYCKTIIIRDRIKMFWNFTRISKTPLVLKFQTFWSGKTRIFWKEDMCVVNSDFRLHNFWGHIRKLSKTQRLYSLRTSPSISNKKSCIKSKIFVSILKKIGHI